MRVTAGSERHTKGRGKKIPYTALDNQGDCTKAYIKDDTIQFQVIDIVDSLQASHLERQIVSAIDHKSFCTPPHRFTLSSTGKVATAGPLHQFTHITEDIEFA